MWTGEEHEGPHRSNVEGTLATRSLRGSPQDATRESPGRPGDGAHTQRRAPPPGKGVGRTRGRPPRGTRRTRKARRTPAGMRRGARSSRATWGAAASEPIPARPGVREHPGSAHTARISPPDLSHLRCLCTEGKGGWFRSTESQSKPTRQSRQDRGRAGRKTLTARVAAGYLGVGPSKGAPDPPHAGGHDRTRSPALAPWGAGWLHA